MSGCSRIKYITEYLEDQVALGLMHESRTIRFTKFFMLIAPKRCNRKIDGLVVTIQDFRFVRLKKSCFIGSC